MSKKPVTLTVDQGTTYSASLVWKDSAGVPYDLTGYVARMQIRKDYATTAIVKSLASPTNIAILPSEGRLDINMTADETKDLPVNRNSTSKPPSSTYVFDLEVQSAEGVVTRLAFGNIVVYAEVTRS